MVALICVSINVMTMSRTGTLYICAGTGLVGTLPASVCQTVAGRGQTLQQIPVLATWQTNTDSVVSRTNTVTEVANTV